ncbi:hypothetical protein [Frankia sp. Cppng1_Ct_nod]|uniref:hypothetical protein n=1 Tax=Frankia sp. Cppng1_Ct_nod TaxID=2897162 RepID=UPI0010419BA4|nr:hypothetical protein [Frankia sp. Cppng1_Ct_nod]
MSHVPELDRVSIRGNLLAAIGTLMEAIKALDESEYDGDLLLDLGTCIDEVDSTMTSLQAAIAGEATTS